MSSSRPVIGISGPDRGGFMAWWFSARAVRRAGGKPKRITPKRPYDIEHLDAVILGGGADIEPSARAKEHEIEAVREAVRETDERAGLKYLLYPFIYLLRRLFSIKDPRHFDKDRDRLEFTLLEAALARSLPVLGICRGAQLINEHLGGSLHHDIQPFYGEAPLPRSIFPVKKIFIEPDTLLYRIIGQGSCRINALHRQAVNTPGDKVTISAREANGIIQAIEIPGSTFLIGVQWHPEYLPLEPLQQKLFKAVVEAAGRTVT